MRNSSGKMEKAGMFGLMEKSFREKLGDKLSQFILENADPNNNYNTAMAPQFQITPSVTLTLIPSPHASYSASATRSVDCASIASTSEPVIKSHIPGTSLKVLKTVGNGVSSGTPLDCCGTLPTPSSNPEPLLNRTKVQPAPIRTTAVLKPGIERGMDKDPNSIRESLPQSSKTKASSSKDIPTQAKVTPTTRDSIKNRKPPSPPVTITRTPTGIKAATGIYSVSKDSSIREMKPNPCNSRCQNHCHANWSESERMDMFQLYWSLPTPEERRDWAAGRIKQENMATKKTPYSNFRTCTFRYSLPHPKMPLGVTVCKNFLIATLDESRSYVERIAQVVKGDGGHPPKRSKRDIPFQRRYNKGKASIGNGNDMGQPERDAPNQVDFGWMTGKVEGPVKPEQPTA